MYNILKVVSKGDYDYAVVDNYYIKTNGNYVLHHRVLIENQLGRNLTSDEVVHHINGIKKDNRIENLEVLSQSEHIKKHKTGCIKILYTCPICLQEVVIRKSKQSYHISYVSCSRSCAAKLRRMHALNKIPKDIQLNINLSYKYEFI